MLRELNTGNYASAANQFDRWVYDNGNAITGLINRRKKEKALFLGLI
jgi:lysozyme